MTKALPMSSSEFHAGVADDVLVTVFNNGAVTSDQNFVDIKSRVAVKDLDGALTKAIDNLLLKADFLQTMTTKEAIAVRLAEASCGSKWMTKHPSKIGEMQSKFAELGLEETFKSLGLDASMDSEAVLKHIKANHMCEKKAAKLVLAAIDAGNMEAAAAARAGKAVLTL